MSNFSLETLFQGLNPRTSEGADMLLDLREAMMSQGHPGYCVRCFFGLLGDLRQKGALLPLRHWLEKNLELEIAAEGQELEVLPVMLDKANDLEGFCNNAMQTVREDRAYSHPHISLRFRYKAQAVMS
jgi:hypothetical protein